MACLGLPEILRIARSGVAEIPGAADHLATCAACAAAVGTQVRASRDPESGAEQFGRYQVLSKRGRGAFGSVFEAYDPALDRRVAIKLIAFSTPSSPAALAELLREAQAMAQIHHPNVIPIFDVGRTRDGVFLTMPIVDGETLETWGQRQRATSEGVDPERVIANFGSKVAAGLSAIHAAGFVHRDVKPSNVLVAGSNAWVADLGLARRAPRHTEGVGSGFTHGELTASTHTDSFGGTPAYMAPECLAGGAASPASDQYALAVSLVEILTGHRPFVASTYSELLATTRGSSPNLAEIPQRYHATLTRALHPDPAQRFPSIATFQATLVAALPRARRIHRARYVVIAAVPVVVVAAWLSTGSVDDPQEVPTPPVSIKEAPAPAPPTDAGPATEPRDAPTSARPSRSLSACADRCLIDRDRTAGHCAGHEASCRATSGGAFAPCTEALDAATCNSLRDHYVQSCIGHEVMIDPRCADLARACASSCTANADACETAKSAAPSSAASCRAAWLQCRATAAADLDALERTRRRGWDGCRAANARCQSSTAGASCGEILQRCNTAVAADYERGTELVDREDHRCLVVQNECVLGRPADDGCKGAAESCITSCARSQYVCLATPLPSHECSAAADHTLVSCRSACERRP